MYIIIKLKIQYNFKLIIITENIYFSSFEITVSFMASEYGLQFI